MPQKREMRERHDMREKLIEKFIAFMALQTKSEKCETSEKYKMG
jgi:hypothetical protein